MKLKSIIIGLLLIFTFSFFACTNDKAMEDNAESIGENSTNTNYDSNANDDGIMNNDTKTNTNTDVVTSPSRANSPESFDSAINNSWIVIVENDLQLTNDITLKSGFKKTNSEENGKLVDAPRVLVIFSKDESGNVKDLYTLTVPRLTILDEGTKLEGGTLKGDVYVDANNVVLQQIKIDGNVYFKDENSKTSFVIDENSQVTGSMEIK